MSKLYNVKVSRLISLLKSFNLKEKRDLEKFLKLSFYGLTKRDRELLKKLLLTMENNKKFDEENYWNTALFEKELKNKNRIKSRIFKAIEHYICLLEIRNNEGMKLHLLTSFYFRNGLLSNLTQALNRGIQKLSALKNANLDYRIFLYWLHEKMVFIAKDVRQETIHMNGMAKELTEFHSINKMRIICEKLNRLAILNSGKDALYYRDEVEYLKKSSISIYVNIYYHLYLLHSEEKSSSFDIINNEIEKLDSSLNPELLKEAYVNLMNYCIRNINERKFEFANPFFNYAKFLDTNNMLVDHNIMSIGRFKNIMVICYILDNIEWATYFIDKYSGHLQETKDINQKDFLSLNHAILALWRNDYDQCIEHIHKFQSSTMYHKDVYYKISCDKLLLKLYYEKEEFESIENKIPVIIVYIRNRKKLSEKRKNPNLKFLYILDKINRKKIVDIENLKGNIPIADYIWLKKVYGKNKRLTST